MVTVFHYTSVNAKQFDRLNIDSLAGKCQKRQNLPRQNFALYGYSIGNNMGTLCQAIRGDGHSVDKNCQVQSHMKIRTAPLTLFVCSCSCVY